MHLFQLAQKTLEKLQENFGVYQKPLDTWNNTQVFYIQATGKSFGEVFMAEEYLKVLSSLKDLNNKVNTNDIINIYIYNIFLIFLYNTERADQILLPLGPVHY